VIDMSSSKLSFKYSDPLIAGNTTRVQMMKINFNAKLLFFFLVSTLTLSFSVQAAGIVGGIVEYLQCFTYLLR